MFGVLTDMIMYRKPRKQVQEPYVRYRDKYGKSRIGLRKTCQTCRVEFITRYDDNQETCGRKCYLAWIKTLSVKVSIICGTCQQTFLRDPCKTKNSKSGYQFCSRKCKEQAQRLGGIAEIQPDHYGTGPIAYRSLFTEDELFCRRCGYDEFSCSVHIHHIDENRENNDKANLMPLCGNCHLGLHHGFWSFDGFVPLEKNACNDNRIGN